VNAELDDRTLAAIDRETEWLNRFLEQKAEVEELMRSMRGTPAGRAGYVDPVRLAERLNHLNSQIERAEAKIDAVLSGGPR
jgi:hypothetical protein